jgi:FSR family fosmidomycin resistance protein-like MFS transporter
MTEIATDIAARPALGHDLKLVGLVGTAHGLSHFYQLVLPPIFPLLTAAFGVGYAELGLVVSLGLVVAGLLQTPAGILVDRLGAGRMLVGGLALYSGATLLIGLAPGFWWLAPLSIIAGLGDCVFHPADYAIMNARVDAGRLGRAYGIHSLAGNIGWVAAPFSVLGLTALFGWRVALVVLGGAGLAFALYLASQRAVLGDATRAERPAAGPGTPGILLSRPILMCFFYFAFLAAALSGLQTFLPSAVPAAFDVGIATANLLLTSFLVASSLGVVAGGVIADRFPHHRLVIAVGLAAGAVSSLVFALAALPLGGLIACASVAGLALGGTSPARDMLVRGATPPGATGKVFGFVYSGLDLGAVIATPLLGLLIDQGLPRLVFVVSAVTLVAAIATAFLLGAERKAG